MFELLTSTIDQLTFQAVLWLAIGVVIGLIFGVIPGLGSVAGMTVVLPLTYAMDTASAFAFLAGIYMAAVCAGSITAILMRIPGDAGSLATMIDGYELTKQGKGKYALGAAIGSSTTGGVLGSFAFLALLPVFGMIAISLNAAAYFWIVFLGLAIIVQVIQGDKAKGYAAACIGVMAGTVGVDIVSGHGRYTLDTTYLLGGIPLIPLLLGLFGIVHMLDMVRRPPANGDSVEHEVGGSVLLGAASVIKQWSTTLKAAVFGILNGAVPGLGGPTANLMAYSNAKRSAGSTGTFGDGDVRGVIAPETANNATVAPSMVPTLTLGVPGTVSAAVFMGALVLHGLQPGRSLVEDNSHILYGIVVFMFIAALLLFPIALISASTLSKISLVPHYLLVPLVFVTLVFGTYANRGLSNDIWSLIIIGAIGYILVKTGYPPVPIIIGFILGPILEDNLRQALIAGDGSVISLLGGPTQWLIAISALLVLVWPVLKKVFDYFLGKKTYESKKLLTRSSP